MPAIREIEVTDLQNLISVLTQDEWQPSEAKYRVNIAYRGLSWAGYELDTGLARLQGAAASGLEDHLLRNFKKYAHRDATPGDSIWNWLSLAQHHGLPTRLLDWTFSPYVALHFATADPQSYSRAGAIWCVDYVAAHRLLPDGLRVHVEPLDHGLFTTEALQAAANTLPDTERVLFPGLDGLCRWLTRHYGDRPEKMYPDAQISPSEPSNART